MKDNYLCACRRHIIRVLLLLQINVCLGLTGARDWDFDPGLADRMEKDRFALAWFGSSGGLDCLIACLRGC